MSIVQTMNSGTFMDALLSDRSANWSYEAAQALYDYYDQLGDDIGEPVEFDRVAIRCEWNQYDSLKEAFDDYSGEAEPGDEYTDDQAREYLEDRTTLIELSNGHVLVMAF